MKRSFIFSFASIFCLTGCDDTPSYVQNAKSDLTAAIVANIFNNPYFGCESLQENNDWYIGCFEKTSNPNPFLLFSVKEDESKTNPPFIYRLQAINGKAKQYANHAALKMFEINDEANNSIDIETVRKDFIEKYAK